MGQRTSERFEQKNFFEANKLIVGLVAVILGVTVYQGSWILSVLIVVLLGLRVLSYKKRGTVVVVTNTHLKITEKGSERKIRWDEISKPKAMQGSVGGFTVDRVLRFKEGKKRHKLIISELENEDAFLQNFTIRTA